MELIIGLALIAAALYFIRRELTRKPDEADDFELPRGDS